MKSHKPTTSKVRIVAGISLVTGSIALLAASVAGASTPSRPPKPTKPFNQNEAHPFWAPGDVPARNADGTIKMMPGNRRPDDLPALPPNAAPQAQDER